MYLFSWDWCHDIVLMYLYIVQVRVSGCLVYCLQDGRQPDIGRIGISRLQGRLI